jgi:hypothetical protein
MACSVQRKLVYSSDGRARLKRQRSQRESLVMSVTDWRDVSLIIFPRTDKTSAFDVC